MSEITPRSRIAEQAREAAKFWADNPQMPKPRNPWDRITHTEHHIEWAACFELALLEFSAGRVEA